MNKISMDKISDLPDCLLHHIFSYLNMEEAVRSSVLSKRWRNLWTSLPTLNFEYKVIISPDDEMEGGFNVDDDDDDEGERIVGLVDKVFIHRDGSNNIQRFSLICPYLPETSPVGTWVTSALRCNVQELVIEIPYGWWLWRHPLVTCNLFNSESLTFFRFAAGCPFNESMDQNSVLIIRYLLGLKTLKLPDSVCLPSLKTLSLKSLVFADDYDGTNKLVSSCPVLESLTIRHCLFCEHINIKISSHSLKHLVFEHNDEVYEGASGVFPGSVKLITPNLISFRCKDYISKRYYLEDISSLIKADICMRQSPVEEEYGDEYMPPEVKKNRRAQRMLKFLRAFRNVKDLTLSAAILEVLSGSPDLLEAEPIKLSVLSILRLKTFLSRDTIPAIAYLLNISPEMKSLIVEISQITSGSSDIGEYPEAETSSQCLLDNLELAEIRDAIGCVNELYFIKLLLKNAKVLKKMVVYTSKKDSPEREERLLKFNEKLLTFPKASSNITVSVI